MCEKIKFGVVDVSDYRVGGEETYPRHTPPPLPLYHMLQATHIVTFDTKYVVV
jgi:hypothetical protein